ncbi:YraN family protein [Rhodococcus sp. HNM0569]|uniref:YraN family protein n=1 Tax=Rhodococcus sp. HNM0569 TaxID=2716340 RepID=UPI00146CADCD|nr:YraN family protein [Rhodococcus sp. HNM0569]NLU81530.1 YraN family protein [Rhodococcus sp. HNM0569]
MVNERGRVGLRGEDLAAQFLTDAGIDVLARNWRSRFGEIDLVGADGDTVVFVEVKTRTGNGYGTPAEAVTVVKQRRIRLLGLEWLTESDRRWARVRFDVVSVHLRRGYRPVVDHLRGAF